MRRLPQIKTITNALRPAVAARQIGRAALCIVEAARNFRKSPRTRRAGRATLRFLKSMPVGILLLAFAITVLFPIVWIIYSSFKSTDEISASPWGLPASPQWSNFVTAWVEGGIGVSFINSAIVTAFTLAILLPVGAMAAYVFALYPFKGSKFLFGTFIGGMMIPQFLAIVPLFILMTNLGLQDTKTGLTLVYVAYSLGFTIFVLTGFFQTLPKALIEAAMIDGCGHAGAFWRVMLPLAKTGLIVVGIFNGIGLWNEYPLALVLMSSNEQRTLPLGIQDFAMGTHYAGQYGALFAGLVIVMIPVMAVYWVFRDKIHETMLAGALKG
jgi:N-acetylglucosamine transport system permease protein